MEKKYEHLEKRLRNLYEKTNKEHYHFVHQREQIVEFLEKGLSFETSEKLEKFQNDLNRFEFGIERTLKKIKNGLSLKSEAVLHLDGMTVYEPLTGLGDLEDLEVNYEELPKTIEKLIEKENEEKYLKIMLDVRKEKQNNPYVEKAKEKTTEEVTELPKPQLENNRILTI